MLVADVHVPVPGSARLSYLVPEELSAHVHVGSLVSVPVRSRTLVGCVARLSDAPPAGVTAEKMKPLASVMADGTALPADVVALIEWVAQYYLTSPGEVLRTSVPPGVGTHRRTRRSRVRAPVATFGGASTIRLNDAQAAAAQAIAESAVARRFHPFLLFGVTGSGKTEVYLDAARRTLAAGRGVLFLTPEISLTAQLVARVRAALPDDVIVLHSALARGERATAWEKLWRGEARVALGARSAVFAPVRDLGLVIVDEEHDGAYKQGESPRYNGRDIALVRARATQAACALGSATPSLESWANARADRYTLLRLPDRVDGRSLARVRVVDMRARKDAPRVKGAPPIISPDLRDAIADRLARREQVLLYQNRRGHSTTLQCWECGWVSRCDACDVALTYHASGGSVRCHYCGFRARAPETCPGCSGVRFRFGGVGTQKVEAWLAGEFPGARILRVDLDTVRRKGAHEQLLASFASGDADILLGTQMIAKGLDIPRVTLVGVIQADTQLHLPDFRSAERTFQLLTQVAGRAGRGDTPGEVLLQTMSPDHPAILAAAAQDFERFARTELLERDDLLYPPSGRLVGFLVSSTSAHHTQAAVSALADIVRAEAEHAGVVMLGPAPRPIEKLMGRYRWQILLKGRAPKALAHVVRASLARYEPASGVRVIVDVDPQDLL